MFSHFRIVLISTIISTFAFADLFFSEYAEGSSNNKWLEVYNPTDNALDMKGTSIFGGPLKRWFQYMAICQPVYNCI